MEKRLKKKIRNRLWMMSSIFLVIYISALVVNPTAWLSLMPIIVPTAGLTVGIPTYAIIRHTKEGLENITHQPLNVNDKDIVVPSSSKNNDKVDINNEQIAEENVIIHENTSETISEKRKVKTKGTIK